jgi:hypothetical protein
MGLFSDPDPDLGRHIPDRAGDTVSLEYIENLSEYLKDDEVVYHVIRGPKAGIGEGASDAEAESTGTKGFVTTGITDRRVIIRVPHFMTDDKYTIRYENIQGIEMRTKGALGFRVVTIHTGGKSYWVSPMGNMDGDDIHEIVDFVNKKIGSRESQSGATKSPKQRLSEIEDMRDDGLITESEYEEKRAEILDDV